MNHSGRPTPTEDTHDTTLSNDTLGNDVLRADISRRTFLKAGALGLGSVGLGSWLTGCSSSKRPTATVGQASIGSGSGSHSLSYWDFTTSAETVANGAVNSWIALFTSANPGDTVHRIYVPTDLMVTKVIGSGESKSGPDVFTQDGQLDQLVPSHAVADLTPYWDAYPDKHLFVPAAVGKRDGRVYSVKGFSTLVGLWYNADILREFSIEPPTTFDELDAALKKIGKKYIGLTIAGDSDIDADFQARPFLSGYGFDYLHPEVAPLEETFSLFEGWLKAGYLPSDISTWTQATSFPRFTSGGMAFCVNGNWQVGAAKAAKFNYGVVPMPTGPKGGNVYLGGTELSVGAYSGNTALAWKFLTDSYLSKAGARIAADVVGAIPTRTDVKDDPVLSDPVHVAFSRGALAGAAYPDPGLGSKVGVVRQVFGQGWNSVLAGQASPSSAAQTVVSGIKQALA